MYIFYFIFTEVYIFICYDFKYKASSVFKRLWQNLFLKNHPKKCDKATNGLLGTEEAIITGNGNERVKRTRGTEKEREKYKLNGEWKRNEQK